VDERGGAVRAAGANHALRRSGGDKHLRLPGHESEGHEGPRRSVGPRAILEAVQRADMVVCA
jgi:hypothetical protein